jgi:ABC-type multidrug transport system fused ATPase/permease subunit
MNHDIQFDNVDFIYPSRQDVSVLHNLSLIARAGQTTALVGPSGCGQSFSQNKDSIYFYNLLIGKSTCLSLLLRHYELSSGQIKIGNRSITNYNLKQLRQNIGIVNQEPVDFFHIFFYSFRN